MLLHFVSFLWEWEGAFLSGHSVLKLLVLYMQGKSNKAFMPLINGHMNNMLFHMIANVN